MGKKKNKIVSESKKVVASDPGLLAIRANYDAGKMGRRLASWNPSSAGPNKVTANLQTIRNRSRDAGRNEWAAESTTNTFVTDMVGTGIACRPKTTNSALKKSLTKLWDEWVKVCDADGVLDFYGQQELVTRTFSEAGEAFVRIRPRRLYDGLTVPLQIQLLEPEMVPQLDQDLPSGNRIRQGIEFDKIGRRVAYWMYREHPGDFAATANINDLYPIPADQIFHLYKPTRIGQLRGVPTGTSSLVRMKTVGDYDDSVTEKAKLQNLFTGVITRPAPMPGQENVDPLTGQVIDSSSFDTPMVTMEPGGMIELSPGEDISFSSPPATGVGYNDFMRQQYLGISAGRGVPYELATGDITNISDRTLRVVIQQYRRGIEQKQWLYVIPMFCQKVRDAWVDAAVLAGHISIADAEESTRVEWSPQAWQYIHPVQDVQSKVAEIDAGLVSRDQTITSRGYDPEEVDSQRAAGKVREEKLGLAIIPVDPKQAIADKAVADKRAAQKAKAEVDLIVAQTNAAHIVAESERTKGESYSRAQDALELKSRAEEIYLSAKAKQSESEVDLAKARIDELKSQLALVEAKAEHDRRVLANESDARIAESLARTELATAESEIRTIAIQAAEKHAQEHRELLIDADRTRAEVAKIELQAAMLGLNELRSE